MANLYITPAQCRMARALLNWTQPELAERCELAVMTISKFEKADEGARPEARTLEKIASVFEIAGIEFTADDGVKRKSLNTRTYRGQPGFVEFMNLVYETARDIGGEFCVSNVDETIFTQRVGEAEDAAYTQKMKAIKGNYNFKILIREGDTNFIASDYAEYKWVPEDQFHSVPFYVFGDNLAFLIFDEQTTIYLINNAEIAAAQRTQFNLVWKAAKVPDAS